MAYSRDSSFDVVPTRRRTTQVKAGNVRQASTHLSNAEMECNPELTLDQAIAFLVQVLRQMVLVGQRGSDSGYDFQISTILRQWVASQKIADNEWANISRHASTAFLDAAWELSRRGLLRPSVRELGTGEGASDGCGYSLTLKGEAWLTSVEESHSVILEPGALAAAFGRFQAKFGGRYHQRAQEAVKCRNADAWLATCTMVGAAAESILMAAALAKTGNEVRIMRAYVTSNGPKKILDLVVGRAPDYVKQPFRAGMNLLSYWQDVAVHARATPISTIEADQALHQLLTLSRFSFDNWDKLTCSIFPK